MRASGNSTLRPAILCNLKRTKWHASEDSNPSVRTPLKFRKSLFLMGYFLSMASAFFDTLAIDTSDPILSC